MICELKYIETAIDDRSHFTIIEKTVILYYFDVLFMTVYYENKFYLFYFIWNEFYIAVKLFNLIIYA